MLTPIQSISQAYLEHPKVVGTSLEKGVRAINDAAGNLVTFVDSYRKLTQLQEPVISTLRLKDFLEGIMELLKNLLQESLQKIYYLLFGSYAIMC